jgi:hypothetical protein
METPPRSSIEVVLPVIRFPGAAETQSDPVNPGDPIKLIHFLTGSLDRITIGTRHLMPFLLRVIQ